MRVSSLEIRRVASLHKWDAYLRLHMHSTYISLGFKVNHFKDLQNRKIKRTELGAHLHSDIELDFAYRNSSSKLPIFKASIWSVLYITLSLHRTLISACMQYNEARTFKSLGLNTVWNFDLPILHLNQIWVRQLWTLRALQTKPDLFSDCMPRFLLMTLMTLATKTRLITITTITGRPRNHTLFPMSIQQLRSKI